MKTFTFWRLGVAGAGLLLLSGCDRQGRFAPVDMWNRSRYKPYEETSFYADRTSSRTMPMQTVARGQLHTDEPFYYGTQNGRYIAGFPRQIKLDAALLQRGQERYQIYCQMCHGEAGYGNGMIVKRGFSPPPSYHIPRLVTAPNGHFFDVITNGYGAMYSYAARVPVQDRWAIVAYIRALQRSQHGVSVQAQNAIVNSARDMEGTSNRRDNTSGEAASTHGGGSVAGPNETSQLSPVPAEIGSNGRSDNTEN